MLSAGRSAATGRHRQLIDTAVDALQRYTALTRRHQTANPETQSGESWDQVLAAIDEILEYRQHQHLLAVDRAGRSGRQPRTPAADATNDGMAT